MSDSSAINRRPKYLNLLRIRMPLPALVSIMHRVSGVALFLALPVLLCLFQMSVESPDTFDAMREFLRRSWVKPFTLALLWAFFHHLCAGLRHLALDMHWGVALAPARASARVALAAGIALTAAAAFLLWCPW